ncbi:unnamed protein product [Closterium sp. NIES-53]
MTSLRSSGGSCDGGGGSSGSGGRRSSSHRGAVRWGVSGGGQLQLQQRQCETLPPQQLHEWYASRSGGGGSSGSRCAAVRLGVSGGGLTQLQRRPRETLTPQPLREWYAQRGASRSSARYPYVIRTGDRAGQTCETVGHTQSRCVSCLSDTWRAEFGNAAEHPRWLELLRHGVDIFAPDYDAILTAMYALTIGTEGDCSLCVLPDPVIEAAALGASESALPGTAPAEALHTFTLDSCASHCFFHDSTTLTPLSAPVPVRLADPSGGPILTCSSIVLPCPAVPSGSLSGLHLPSCSTNLVSTTALQDVMVTTTTPGGQCVSMCTCTRTGRHLATFTRRPGSSLYTLATKPPQVAASAHVSASGPVAPPCSCRLLSHQTLLWHHRLGHPSLPRFCGMHSRLLVSGLPRLSTWTCGAHPASVDRAERYFLLVVDDYTRYTTVFPLRSKGEVPDVLIPWIRAVRLQLRELFCQDLPVLRLHSDRGGEFSSDLLRDFCRGEGILQSFTLPDSPQQNGIAEHPSGLVMEVARTSRIHAATPHFQWPFAVRYAAHQLNLWPSVSLPETSPTLRWPGEVGDTSVFRVWGSRAFVCDMSADKLSACAIPCVFLGFVPDAPGLQFYHPTSRRVFPSQDATFDMSVPFYRLFPYRSAPPPPPPLFLAPSPPPVDPLPPQGPAPSGVSQVDPLPGTVPVEVAIDSGAARGAASRGTVSGGAEPAGAEPECAEYEGAGSGGAEPGGAEPGGVEPGGAESEGAESGGAEPGGVERGGAEHGGVESGGAEPRGTASSGGPAGASPRLSPRPKPLFPQQLREWFAQRTRLRSGAAGAGGSAAGGTGAGGVGTTRLGGAGVTAGAGGTGGAGAASPGGARTRGTRAAGTSDGAGGTGAGGAGAGDSGAVDSGAGGARAGGAVSGGTGARGTVQRRPFFVMPQPSSLPPHDSDLCQVLSLLTSIGLPPRLLCPPPRQSLPQLQPDSLLPAPSPYAEQIDSFTERREPESRPALPVRAVRTGHRAPRPRPPPVPGTHVMALRPSSAPLRVPLPPPPEASLLAVPDPESDLARAASPSVSCLLAIVVTDLSFESTDASALVAELVDFATTCRIDFATALVAESESTSLPSVGAAVSHLVAMLLAPEGDPDAPNIPTPRSYAEAITGPYSSQWQTAMDAEMASWKSRGTYVDAIPPSWVNIVDGMWIFRVKRPPGSLPAFKARYVAQGYSQRHGVDYIQTFSPNWNPSSKHEPHARCAAQVAQHPLSGLPVLCSVSPWRNGAYEDAKRGNGASCSVPGDLQAKIAAQLTQVSAGVSKLQL